jgi:hypothetical protein
MENPHVQATLIEIVEHQVRDNDPPETRQTLDRLLAGFGPSPRARCPADRRYPAGGDELHAGQARTFRSGTL